MIIPPGSTIGVLGSGQLGRMFAFEAHRLGYRVLVFSPGSDTPAGQAANREITGCWDDVDALTAFARQVDVITFEFENVPPSALQIVERHAPVRPGPHVLRVARNRLDEKETLSHAGLPVADFAAVSNPQDVVRFFAAGSRSGSAVLKSAEAGYDGKGQTVVADADDADAAIQRVGVESAVIEEFVDCEFELSVVAARSVDGSVECLGPIVNHHEDHILDVSVAPAVCISPSIQTAALAHTRSVLEELDVIGVLCVEFFQAADGRLLINEIAPRPHNSGHLSIEACVTSQFEQQVRAVCGLPLGSMEIMRPAAMANLLGEHLPEGCLAWQNLSRWPQIKLHLYGKGKSLSRRKMGHLTATAPSAAAAESQVRRAREDLFDHGRGPHQITHVHEHAANQSVSSNFSSDQQTGAASPA